MQENDLDEALERLFEEAGKNKDVLQQRPKQPIIRNVETARVALDEIDIDWTSQEARSTSNPQWIKAGLNPAVIDVLSGKGITTFTPVQGEAFLPVLSGLDVIGRSRTGTGKTLAFGLPGLTRLVELTKVKGVRDANGRMQRGRKVSMLILCPTRELARQVSDELEAVARPLGLFVEVFHGGVSYDPQTRALSQGIDVLVGTPGRIMDHMDRGTLDLSECNIVVLDEADEMLNMGFAEDVEVILEDIGSANQEKTQCLLFSATTPSWVKEIASQYQKDVVAIDATGDAGGARVATTVRHLAVQLPPGVESKKSVLEDIIAVEISKDLDKRTKVTYESNVIAAAAAEKKAKTHGAMQQRIFGKTIVFTETKREADELVSGSVFKSLTAQALHGDVGQKQRDATLNAFRSGAFNVLVATDVAARGIDIQDVDLVIQFDPPRDVDTYVHRSGRTGRAGKAGTSVLLFSPQQARDIIRIERDLGHGFQFDLVGPPSTEAALKAAAKTSAIASQSIPDDTAVHFKEAAAELLASSENPEAVVARCLAAISRRASDVTSRSLITGEPGMATVEMTNSEGRPVSPGDVMFAVSKLSRMSQREEQHAFDCDIGKIQVNPDSGSALFDMVVEDAKKLVAFSTDVHTNGAEFSLLQELEVIRGSHFGKSLGRGGRNGSFDRRGGGDARGGPRRDGVRGGPTGGSTVRWSSNGGVSNNNSNGSYKDTRHRNYHGQNHRSDHEFRRTGGSTGGSTGGPWSVRSRNDSGATSDSRGSRRPRGNFDAGDSW